MQSKLHTLWCRELRNAIKWLSTKTTYRFHLTDYFFFSHSIKIRTMGHPRLVKTGENQTNLLTLMESSKLPPGNMSLSQCPSQERNFFSRILEKNYRIADYNKHLFLWVLKLFSISRCQDCEPSRLFCSWGVLRCVAAIWSVSSKSWNESELILSFLNVSWYLRCSSYKWRFGWQVPWRGPLSLGRAIASLRLPRGRGRGRCRLPSLPASDKPWIVGIETNF